MKKTRWINFLGGTDLVYTLVVVILLGIAFMLFNQVSYIFTPILILVSNVLVPFVIALLLFYLFNPFIDFLEKHKVKRVYGVGLLFLILIGLLGLGIGLLFPLLREQVTSFIENFPSFVDSLLESVTG